MRVTLNVTPNKVSKSQYEEGLSLNKASVSFTISWSLLKFASVEQNKILKVRNKNLFPFFLFTIPPSSIFLSPLNNNKTIVDLRSWDLPSAVWTQTMQVFSERDSCPCILSKDNKKPAYSLCLMNIYCSIQAKEICPITSVITVTIKPDMVIINWDLVRKEGHS